MHITADGHLVVAHDETVDRCSNGKGLIARMTDVYKRQAQVVGAFSTLSRSVMKAVVQV